jgi:hypothetical protein
MATDAPRIAWLLNLDADRELQEPTRYRPVATSGRAHDLVAQIADLVASEDLVLDEATTISSLQSSGLQPDDYLVQAFCPTPSALTRIVGLGLVAPNAPAVDVLRRVNDRAFCAELGQCLPGASFVRDMGSLERQLEQPSPTGRYVIKRAFSFAGREQRRVRDGVLDDSTRGFCRRSFARGEGLQVEPWMERVGDFSRHGYVSAAGTLNIGPTREQRCDPLGRFLGVATSSAAVTDAEAASLAAELKLTAAALSRSGYFGPFGIDAFRYRLPDGSTAFNPRCEINARFTMGYPRALLLDALGSSVIARSRA